MRARSTFKNVNKCCYRDKILLTALAAIPREPRGTGITSSGYISGTLIWPDITVKWYAKVWRTKVPRKSPENNCVRYISRGRVEHLNIIHLGHHLQLFCSWTDNLWFGCHRKSGVSHQYCSYASTLGPQKRLSTQPRWLSWNGIANPWFAGMPRRCVRSLLSHRISTYHGKDRSLGEHGLLGLRINSIVVKLKVHIIIETFANHTESIMEDFFVLENPEIWLQR